MTRTGTWASTLGFGPKPTTPARAWYGTGTEASSADFGRDTRQTAETARTQSLQYSQESPPEYPTFSSRSSSETPSAESGARRSSTHGRQSTSPGDNHELSEFLPRRAADSSCSSQPSRHNDSRPGREEDDDRFKCGDLCHCGPHCAPLAVGGILCLTLSTLAACKSMC